MIWWYFHREGDTLIKAVPSDLPKRPTGSNESNNNPHTPWYNLKDHFDEDHVHVYASTYWSAYAKALKLINS